VAVDLAHFTRLLSLHYYLLTRRPSLPLVCTLRFFLLFWVFFVLVVSHIVIFLARYLTRCGSDDRARRKIKKVGRKACLIGCQ